MGPYGFAYHVDLGMWEGSKVIHAGLVATSKPMGLEKIHAISFALSLGNLINFGPYFCTNISHLPATAGLFAHMVQECYPSPKETNSGAQYLPILRILRDRYISVVLELDPYSVCEKTYRLLGSLDRIDPGIETDWRVVRRQANTADRDWFRKHMQIRDVKIGRNPMRDDMLQVGKVDYRTLAAPIGSAAQTLRIRAVRPGPFAPNTMPIIR